MDIIWWLELLGAMACIAAGVCIGLIVGIYIGDRNASQSIEVAPRNEDR